MSGPGGFDVKPQPEHEEDHPVLPLLEEPHGFEPPPHVSLFDDPMLGGGPPDAAHAAFGHLADDSVMRADTGTPPKQVPPKQVPPKAPPPKTAPPKVAKAPKAPPAAPAKKQPYTWQKIKDTTDAKPGGFDIRYMKNVDPRVLKSIDGNYADDIANAQVTAKLKTDPEIKKIEAARKKANTELRKLDGTTAKKGEKERDDPNVDIANIGFEMQRQMREAAIRADLDKHSKKSTGSQSVSVPEGDVRRQDMQTLKRLDYVNDVTALTGDFGVTQHYLESMRAVKGTDKTGHDANAMILAGETATAYDGARDEFAAAHPGFQVPTTSVAYGTRGLHEEKESLGMLGHVLATSVDLYAVENPNQMGPGKEGLGVNDLLLRTIGADSDPNHKARAKMDYVPDQDVAAMADGTSTNATTIEKQVRTQYQEMSRTSTNVKNAFTADERKDLHTTQAEYFQLSEDEKREAQLKKDVAKDPSKAEDLATLHTANTAERDRIQEVVDANFGQYATTFQDDIDAQATDTKHDEKWKAAERAVLEQAKAQIVDPERIFGGHHKDQKTGALVSNGPVVSNVPVLQYLDKGFLKDDGTDYAELKKQGKQGQIFNEDVVVELMKHGFNWLNYYGDTMHFDHIPTQNHLIPTPGGQARTGPNMKQGSVTPTRMLPDIQPKPFSMHVDPPFPEPPVPFMQPRPIIETTPGAAPAVPFQRRTFQDPP